MRSSRSPLHTSTRLNTNPSRLNTITTNFMEPRSSSHTRMLLTPTLSTPSTPLILSIRIRTPPIHHMEALRSRSIRMPITIHRPTPSPPPAASTRLAGRRREAARLHSRHSSTATLPPCRSP